VKLDHTAGAVIIHLSYVQTRIETFWYISNCNFE